jgi:hypothetical protein
VCQKVACAGAAATVVVSAAARMAIERFMICPLLAMWLIVMEAKVVPSAELRALR